MTQSISSLRQIPRWRLWDRTQISETSHDCKPVYRDSQKHDTGQLPHVLL